VVAEGEADEGGEVEDVVEVVVGAEVAGAGHDVLVGEGGAEEVGVNVFDVEGHGGVRRLVEEVDSWLLFEEIVELFGVGGKVLVSGFGELFQPVDGGAEGDDFAPGLEAGFKLGVDVIGGIGGELVGVEVGIVDHATADEGGVDFVNHVATDNHDAEGWSIHFVGGETDGVGLSFVEDLPGVRHSLGGVDNDNTVLLVDFFDELV